jgi:hypothetical protein
MIEGVSHIILSVRNNDISFVAESRHTEYDSDLGWINIPNIFIQDMYGPGKHLKINSQRFRSDTDYSNHIPAGTTRVIVAGDSFTLGYGVDNQHTWLSQAKRLHKTLEVVNMGQGGYGLDQAYLWYKRDGVRLDHDIFVLAFIAEDFARMNSESFIGYGKPMLAVEDDTLVVKNQPVPRYQYPSSILNKTKRIIKSLGIFQLFQKTFELDDDLRKNENLPFIIDKIADDIQAITKKKGVVPVMIFLPTNFDSIGNSTESLRNYMAHLAATKGIIFFDLVSDARMLPLGEFQDLFIHEDVIGYSRSAGHYNEKGNVWIAKKILYYFATHPEISSRLK